MAKGKYSKIGVNSGINGHGQSIRLALTSRDAAIQQNQVLKEMGIAAEYPVRKDGELMPLVYRDRSARKRVADALDLPPGDY